MEMENKIVEVIAGLYNENDYLLDGDCLNTNEKEYYKNIKIGMPGDIAVGAVHQMACFMQRYYKRWKHSCREKVSRQSLMKRLSLTSWTAVSMQCGDRKSVV